MLIYERRVQNHNTVPLRRTAKIDGLECILHIRICAMLQNCIVTEPQQFVCARR